MTTSTPPCIRFARPILLALTYLVVSLSHAQGAVGVQPPAKLYTLHPGESATLSLRIDNPTDQPMTLRVYPEDWQYDAQGKIVFYPPATLPESLTPWLAFTPSAVELPGRGVVEVRYTLTVPQDAAPGTHWGMLFIEGEAPATDAGPTLASFSIRTGHAIYVNVPPVASAGEIIGIFGEAPAQPEQPYQLALQYLNVGNAMQVVEGRVEIRALTGDLLDTIPVAQTVALPGAARAIQTELYGPLPAGDYLALAILNYGDATTDVAGEYVFTVTEDLVAPEFLFDGAAERARAAQEGQP